MDSRFASLDARLCRLPDAVLLAIGLALISGLALLRVTAADGVPLVDFFLIPVAGVGWFAGRRWFGYVAATVAALASVLMAVVGPDPAPVGSAIAAGTARLVLYIIVLSLLGAMRRMELQHETDARTDPITGAANARAFHAVALTEIDRSRRYQHELSLAYLDVDDLKSVNDELGHVEGDHVLLQVSHLMRCVVRSVDTVARLGGDEFAILMPETRAAEARVLMERLEGELSRLVTTTGQPVTCSIGLVTFLRPPESLQELIAAGDELMYRAKRNGKARVEQAQRSGSAAPVSA